MVKKLVMKDMAVALLGFGTVGRAFASHIDAAGTHDPRISIRAVADSSAGILLETAEQFDALLRFKTAGGRISEFRQGLLLREIPAFVQSLPSHGIRVLVEALPTCLSDGQPALSWLAQALALGISVVTADKGPIVHGMKRLSEEARKGGAKIAFNGTTGVKPPQYLSGCHIDRILGILNGTTNFILTEMQARSSSFAAALARAQDLGIAEPDPSLDIDGWDTACKILILANSWMGGNSRIEEVARSGIGREIEPLIDRARTTGRIVRLLGEARLSQGLLKLSVAPQALPPDSPFHPVAGTAKAAIFHTAEMGEVFVPGTSGLSSIAQTILDDVLTVAGKDSLSSQRKWW